MTRPSVDTDHEALFAAADTGHPLVVSGPSSSRTGSPSARRTATARSPRSTRTPTNSRARCGRAASQPATASRCCARTGPSSSRPSAAAQRAGLRLTTINWHLTGEEAGYIVDDCEATAFVADARFADAAVERGRARAAAEGEDRGRRRHPRVRALGRRARRTGRRRARRSGARRDDALHVGHDRPAEGRAPQHREPRERARSRR